LLALESSLFIEADGVFELFFVGLLDGFFGFSYNENRR
jgi:hypothetical protein